MVKTRYAGLSFGVVLLVAVTVGCGNNDLNAVKGTVTLDGEPLADALLVFTPLTGGRPAAARTDANGKYELVYDRNSSGTITGEHVVEITTGDDYEDDDGQAVLIPERLPKQYNAETDLRAKVGEGNNVFDFDLKSEGEIVTGEEDGDGQ
ncbi:MAG: carboxypeptidase regulatory-like domain-containing protein [Pirellulaceae bacterium]|jgi:hypothetical protein